jgi:hypothetical protein
MFAQLIYKKNTVCSGIVIILKEFYQKNSTLLSGGFLDIVLYFSDVLKEHFTLYSRISSSFEWLIKHIKLVL